MKTSLLCFFVCLCVCMNAQNRLLILPKGDSIGSIRVHPNDGGYGVPDMDYNIPPTPLVISGAFPFDVNFRETANDAVNTFQFQHLQSHYINEQDAFSLDAHFILLGNSDYEYINSVDWLDKAARIKDEIISNKIVQEAMYNWLMPVYQKAFAEMSVPEQNSFLNIFRGGLNYIDTLDFAKEQAVIDDQPWTFKETRGDLNAFIYRRISKNELSGEECRHWLQRIINDLQSVMRKDPKPEDNYVLTSKLNDDYVTAAPWSSYEGYESDFSHIVIMRRTKNSYELLPAHFESLGYSDNHITMGWSDDSAYYSSFFIYDSLGWTFCNSKYRNSCYYHQFLGERKNQTLMLVSGWEILPSKKYGEEVMACFALIDADSGTVLQDSIYIPAIVEGGYYTDNYSFPGFNPHRIIYYDDDTQLFGMMDERGKIILPAKYTSIEATDNPEVFKVNGRKKVKVSS